MWIDKCGTLTKMDIVRLKGNCNLLVAPHVKKMQTSACESCHVEKACLPALFKLPYGAFGDARHLVEVYCENAEEIGGCAFQRCTSLTKIFFPKVKTVGHSAFQGCGKLERVDLPKCEDLAEMCFYDCRQLQRFNGAPKNIGASCFGNCTNLQFIDLRKCMIIGERAFEKTFALVFVEFSVEAESIKSHAFLGSGVSRVVIFAPKCILGRRAFCKCKKVRLVHVNVKRIADEAFYGCQNLAIANVLIHPHQQAADKEDDEDAFDIGRSAFEQCGLKLAFTTAGSIGNDCFSDCIHLKLCNACKATQFGKSCFNCVDPKMVCQISEKAMFPGLRDHVFPGFQPQWAKGVHEKPSLKVLRTARSQRTAYMKSLYVSTLWSQLPLFKYWVVTFLASLRRWKSHLVDVPFEMVMLILSMLSARDVFL